MKAPFGWWFGFEWVHCNGESSRTSALVAARHPRASITWTFAVYVNRRSAQSKPWGWSWWNPPSGYGSACVATPLGGVSIAWQPFMAWNDEVSK